jgi:predicted lipid-binding transport protein (Tim44 family)
MPLSFWIKRFVTMFLGTFAVLLVVGMLKGRAFATAASESALWAGIAATIFIATRIYRSRRGQHCELCRDTPQMHQGEVCSVKKPEPSP